MQPHTCSPWVCVHTWVSLFCLWEAHPAVLVFISAAAAAPLSSARHSHPSLPILQCQGTMRAAGGASGEPSDGVCSVSSLLQEVQQQLSFDHRGKMETLEIDRGCLSLNLKSPNISLKINPARIPTG